MKAFGEIPNDVANRPVTFDKFFELLGTDCPPISSIPVTSEEEKMWIDLQPCILSKTKKKKKKRKLFYFCSLTLKFRYEYKYHYSETKLFSC
jgi:hypothetical protein